jgi:hypothetical protein
MEFSFVPFSTSNLLKQSSNWSTALLVRPTTYRNSSTIIQKLTPSLAGSKVLNGP